MDEEVNEQLEWEGEVAENLISLAEKGAGSAVSLIIDGTLVRRRYNKVMVSGDLVDRDIAATTEIFDAENGCSRQGPNMWVPRACHASVALPSGDVVVFGGTNMEDGILNSYEVFDAVKNEFRKIGYMVKKRISPAAVLLPTGFVLIIGGSDRATTFDCCELYNPVDNKMYPSKAKMRFGRSEHNAILLSTGKVLVCGGCPRDSDHSQTELYDPVTDSFSAGPRCPSGRLEYVFAVPFEDNIFFFGRHDDEMVETTMFYNPDRNAFSIGPTFYIPRYGLCSCGLPDGKVFIGGGYSAAVNATAIVCDISTLTKSPSYAMCKGRTFASACLF